jgi:spermidine synthase
MAILFLFFCSGATALIYEVIWSKYLALLFGSTIQAQTVVLAVFMGGLALGNKLFSRSADRASNSLAVYGRIEIAIGLYALLFSLLYRIADRIFAVVGSALLEHSGFLLMLKGILAMALLLGPTILMGGTLPVLAAWLKKNTADAGRRSARFYSINSLGAVCGAGFSGFWLIEWLGLSETMGLTALVNVAIGLAAIAISRNQSASAPVTNQPAPALESTTKSPGGHTRVDLDTTTKTNAPLPVPLPTSWGEGIGGPGTVAESRCACDTTLFRRACVIVAITGAASMGLEVLASRCLCLIFGASLQVFAIVLIAFILGISVGSAVIASTRRKELLSETTAALLVLGAALLIGLVVFNIENLVSIYLAGQGGLNRTVMGYRYYQILVTVVSIGVLGLPAASLGAVLPLCIRTASETSELLGDRVGRLLTWNTLGAVGGALAAGFVLLPYVGLRGSFTVVGLVLVFAALMVAMTSRRILVFGVGAVVGIFLLFTSLNGDADWRSIFSAGVFRLSDSNFSLAALAKRRELVQLVFYEDAADATVSVERVKGSEELSLRINGKVDASSSGDGSTQLLLAYLPLMAKPASKDVFCFGMGSGITGGATLNYPIDHLTVAENCEPVLRAARLFDPWNNGVELETRTRIYHEDARTTLKLSPQKYDVIIAEPSNPWMIGVASVFTREFYQLAAKRLKPGGIMTQWFHTYEMDDRTAEVVLRTFGTVFPKMEIWDAGEGDIILLGSDRAWQSDPEVYQHALERAGPRKGLATIGIESAEAVLARRMASQYTAFAISGPGAIQSDDVPILEYAAPRTFYTYLHRIGVTRLQRFDERTWQMELASEKANSDLAKLDPPALKTLFDNGQGCANPDLLTYLHGVYAKYAGTGSVRPIMVNNRAMLCSLQGTNVSFGIYTPLSATTNAITRQLAISEYKLRSDPAKETAIDGIQSALDSLTDYSALGSDWSPAYYADLAVKASLRISDSKRARAILLRGLQLDPGSDQLHYLSRILLREGILQSNDLGQFGIFAAK